MGSTATLMYGVIRYNALSLRRRINPLPIQHDAFDVSHVADVAGGVSFDQDEVGGFFGFEGSEAVFDAEVFGSVFGCGS